MEIAMVIVQHSQNTCRSGVTVCMRLVIWVVTRDRGYLGEHNIILFSCFKICGKKAVSRRVRPAAVDHFRLTSAPYIPYCREFDSCFFTVGASGRTNTDTALPTVNFLWYKKSALLNWGVKTKRREFVEAGVLTVGLTLVIYMIAVYTCRYLCATTRIEA